jgi:Sulfotransferase family
MTVRDPDQPHRFFFVHIRKTAGGALRRRMINHFGERAVYPTRGLDGTDPVTLMLSVDHLRERLAARGDQIKVITGHFPLCATEMIDGRFTTLTLLRDPVERTLSSLRNERQNNPAAGQMSLEQIYDAAGEFIELTQNRMTKALALTPAELEHPSVWALTALSTREVARALELTADPETPFPEFTRTHLERAKERLAEIDAFGLQEYFEDFCNELTARFGWDLGEPVRANTTAPLEVSDGFRARIAEDNALDLELYEFAQDLLRDAGRLHEGREAGSGVGR